MNIQIKNKTIGFLLLVLVLAKSVSLHSQVISQTTHYSVDNGLSENHILCMLQDQKGVMWFGNYDGLNKFDGYTFRCLKGRTNQKYQLSNYRVDRLKEDKQGYLWLQTNDSHIYRFDPVTETFLPVPQCIKEFRNYKKPLNRIEVLRDGTIWLSTNESGKEDCFRVENTHQGEGIRLTHFPVSTSGVPNKINRIYLDKNQDTWMLSSTGIDLVKKKDVTAVHLFKESAGALFSIVETTVNNYIGGEHGIFWAFNKKEKTFELIKTPRPLNIIDIQPINNDELFILTNASFFYVYHLLSGTFTEFQLDKLKKQTIYGCYKDRSNHFWIDTDNPGSLFFSPKERSIQYLPVDTTGYVNPRSLKFSIMEDKFNNIWVLTHAGGFYRYNKQLRMLEPISERGDDEKSITNLTHSALADNQGNIWLSTYLQGVDKIVYRHSPFTFTKPVDATAYNSKNEIRSVYQDSHNWLWVGSKKGYVYIYDQNGKLKGYLGRDGRLNSKTPFNSPVYDIKEDRTGTIWLSTKGTGLYRLTPKPGFGFSIVNYQYDAQNIYSINSNSVYSVFEDHKNRIWVATFWGGLNLLETQGGETRFINSRNKLNNYPADDCIKIRYLAEDKYGQILAGTTQGLLVFNPNRKKPEDINFQLFQHQPANPNSMSGNDVQYISVIPNGDVYLSMIGGGVDVIKGGIRPGTVPQFRALNSTDGTPINAVYTITDDGKGNLWMSTQTQVFRYHLQDNKLDVFKPVSRGNYFFSEAAVCRTRQGEIVYGTSNGFVTFNPARLRKSNFVPTICLTQFQLFNKNVNVGDADSLLKQTIDETRELILSSKQNTFSIEYAALDHANPQGILYAYKLDGFDREWNYVGNQRIATYINLPKGKYVFRVKSTNSDGQWVKNEKTIIIHKLPSFWESAWGWLFYFVLILIFSAVVAYVLFVIYRLRNEVAVEQRITNMKLRFFTDISHELRTPLTLIASPVESILKKEPISAKVREQLEIVEKNTARMLRLINQILDFRKIQSEKMKLIVEEVEAGTFLSEICMNFTKMAEENNIHLQVTNRTNNARLWVDKDKFEKIIFNLLSNAFKFTESGRNIEVLLDENESAVVITVSDQGIGINKDRLKLLFNRFESFASSTGMMQNSTGIGLSLTKELVELHKARIEVESEPGKGSEFKVTFRKGMEHFGSDNEFVLHDSRQGAASTDTLQNEETTDAYSVENKDKATERSTILVAEDNEELRGFLKATLSKQYDILEAGNGRTALDIALKELPDLIVSDITMPGLDGIEFARKIKQDMNTSHIPFILLTAKIDLDTKLEAMDLCVDDYITKPFSLTYLEARIENLLKIREQLQTYFKSSLAATSGIITLSKPEITSVDEQFMQKTLKYIEENYEDSEMNIDNIATFTGVSRSSFFKKIKSLTGLAPVDFVREYRIQKAVQMLEAGETNISQIAYSVGINDTKYFSRCFKQRFGINPSEYKAKL